jgi:hypothetical protein
MSKRRFLVVTDMDTNHHVAIPIKRILQIREYKHGEDLVTFIQYYIEKISFTITIKESFNSVVTGCCTFEL